MASERPAPGQPGPGPRVLHVLEAIETGCARHVLDLAATTRGVEHHLAAPHHRVGGRTDHAALAEAVAGGLRHHVVEMRRSPASVRNVAAVLAVRRLARSIGADVLHGHSSIGGVVARLAAPPGTPVAYTPNGIAEGRLALLVERRLAGRTDAFVAVSPSEATEAERLGLAGGDRLHVIPNGVDPDACPLDRITDVLPATDGHPVVASIGRLSAQKATDVLLATMAAVAAEEPDAHFVLVGDGPAPARRAVEAAVAAPAFGGRLHWLPHLPDAGRRLSGVDVYLSTSRFEGLPYAPLEAMRAGAAVVLTDVVGNRDVVDADRTGILVPVDDPGAAAAAVTALLRDPARRAGLATAALAALRTRFDVAASGRAHAALYAALAGQVAGDRLL